MSVWIAGSAGFIGSHRDSATFAGSTSKDWTASSSN
jgi:hypothetical protein